MPKEKCVLIEIYVIVIIYLDYSNDLKSGMWWVVHSDGVGQQQGGKQWQYKGDIG